MSDINTIYCPTSILPYGKVFIDNISPITKAFFTKLGHNVMLECYIVQGDITLTVVKPIGGIYYDQVLETNLEKALYLPPILVGIF